MKAAPIRVGGLNLNGTAPTLTGSNIDGLQVSIRKQLAHGTESSFTLDVNFLVAPGITILFGASGAGKTTLLDCIAGLSSPEEGQIAIGGRLLFDAATGVNVRPSDRKVGFVFQDLGLFPHMTVEENVHYGITHLPKAERRKRADAVLKAFHIAEHASRLPKQLSGGERQRVALARALVTEPCILLLDEPLSALDTAIKARIMDDLCAWNRSHCIPILYVTHSHAEVFALGESIVVLKSGRILAEGSPQSVLQSPRHEGVAQLAGFENVFDGHITGCDEHLGTMTCRLGDTDLCLETPLGWHEPGVKVRIGLRAGDILIAGESPRCLSARNVLSGTITSISECDYLAKVVVDCGLPFTAHVTLAARERMRLEPGSPIWLVIKTHACAILRSTNSPVAHANANEISRTALAGD
jgi:molybdate transport system ATP-binding protein